MFPIDPSSPLETKQTNKWSRIEKICLIFSTSLGAISLFYAAISFSLSQKAYDSAQQQFIQNSIESDKQFKQITNLLNSYQRIADSSLLIINSQLSTTRQLLGQQIGSSKPNVGLLRTEYFIKDDDDKKKIGVLITVTNSGIRTAYNVGVLTKYISYDLKLLHENNVKKMELTPLTPKTTYEELIVPLKAKIEFYLIISVSYYDSVLKENTINHYVVKPSALAPTFEEIEPKLKDEILKRFSNK